MSSDMVKENLVFVNPAEVTHCANMPRAHREALDRINQKVAGAETLDSAMDLVVDSLSNVCACDRLSLHLVDTDRQRMIARWVQTKYTPVLLDRGYTQDLQGSSLGPILARGVIRIIRDLKDYLRGNPDSEATRLLVEEGNLSSLTCPLLVDARPVGILFASSRRLDAYATPQACIHQLIAERLGQAVEKAYRIEQLSAANQAYMEVLGFVTHELKAPLGSMLSLLNAVSGGYCGPVTPEQTQKLGRVHHKGMYLLNLIRDYLALARFESGQAEAGVVEDVDLYEDVILPAVDDTSDDRRERGMSLELEPRSETLRCPCDPALLRIAIANLLSNATKYGRPNTDILLRVTRKEGCVTISVRNTGQGFRAEDREKLFHRFSRLSDPAFKGVRGTGVGLYTAWRIARVHGGKLTAESAYGHWAEFRLTIPERPGPVSLEK